MKHRNPKGMLASEINGDSVGEKLKHARLQKSMSIEELAARTKISKQKILEIEEDDFSDFPAEIYLNGFLTNLAESLGLDGSSLIAFRNELKQVSERKIKEEESFEEELAVNEMAQAKSPIEKDPEPVLRSEESSERKKNQANENDSSLETGGTARWKGIAMIAVGFVAALLVTFLAWSLSQDNTVDNISNESEKSGIEKTFVSRFYSSTNFVQLRQGDSIQAFHNNALYKISMDAISTSNVRFSFNDIPYNLQAGNSLFFDLDSDATEDIRLDLEHFGGDAANVHLSRLGEIGEIDMDEIWTEHPHIAVGRQYTLFKRQYKSPIYLYLKADTQTSHLNYNVDGRRQNALTLQRGEFIEIDAEEHLEIVIGNYKSVRLIVNYMPIDLSIDSDKYSVTKIIKWIQDPDNSLLYDLVLLDYNQ